MTWWCLWNLLHELCSNRKSEADLLKENDVLREKNKISIFILNIWIESHMKVRIQFFVVNKPLSLIRTTEAMRSKMQPARRLFRGGWLSQNLEGEVCTNRIILEWTLNGMIAHRISYWPAWVFYFCHNSRMYRTDGRTDWQTDIDITYSRP